MSEEPWNLIEDTMEKVNDFLGEYWINELEETGYSENSEDQTIGCLYDKEQSTGCLYEQDIFSVTPDSLQSEASDTVPDDLRPQPRARSNTWPRRHFNIDTATGAAGLPQVSEECSYDLTGGCRVNKYRVSQKNV